MRPLGELAEYFLSKEEFDKLSINFNVSITSLGEVSENDICQMCREFIFETKKDYTTLKMKEMFGISDLSPHTQSSLEIFKTLGTLYIGGSSMVELKTPQEGYNEEMKCMELVKQTMANGNS